MLKHCVTISLFMVSKLPASQPYCFNFLVQFSTTTSAFLLDTMTHLLTIKLESCANYLLWRKHFDHLLISQPIDGYFDGFIKILAKTIHDSNNKNVSNPAYHS